MGSRTANKNVTKDVGGHPMKLEYGGSFRYCNNIKCFGVDHFAAIYIRQYSHSPG